MLWSSLVAQQVMDPELSLLWLMSLLWHGFNPTPWAQQFPHAAGGDKKKKKKNAIKLPCCVTGTNVVL